MSCHRGPTIVKYNVYCGESGSTGEGTTYTFENINVTGQGVFDNLTGTAVSFKGIASSGSTITVTNDDPNNTVNIELSSAAVIAAVPAASTTVQGKVELSTDAEALAKASTTVALTPSNLAALAATTTFAGLTEYATDAETQLGTSTTLAVTPAGLQSVVDLIPVNRVYANEAARTAATPDFIGQLAVQQDNLTTYIGSNTLAGYFDVPLFTFGIQNLCTVDTGIDLQGGEISISDSTASGKMVNFFDGGTLNFLSTGRFAIANAVVPADSVIMTTSTAGQLTSMSIQQILSTANFSPVYTITGDTTRRTFDPTTVTLPQIADVVATLLRDLAAVDLPEIA